MQLIVVLLITTPVFAQINAEDSLRISTDTTSAPVPKPKKNPTGASLRSLAIPGWGQYYNDQKIKAALVLAIEAGEIGTAIYWNMQARNTSDPDAKFLYEDYRNQALWFLAGTIVLSMLDAYVDAHLADFDEGPSLQEPQSGLLPESILRPPQPRLALRWQIRL